MADESADNRTSVTLDEALAWIKVISRSRLLAILREPNRESVDAIAFAGFRRNAEVIAHPVIIRRLALEATRNPDFAESLRTAAEEVAASTTAQVRSGKESRAQTAQAKKEGPGPNAGQDAHRDDRERLRREIERLRREIKLLETAVGKTEEARAHAERDRETALRDTAVRERAGARMERQIDRLRTENEAMRRALREFETGKIRQPRPQVRPAPTQKGAPSPWPSAVERLIHSGHSLVSLSIAQDVLRTHPDDIDALRVAAHVLQERRSPDAPAALRRLLVRTAAGSAQSQADALFRLLTVVSPEANDRELRTFFCGLDGAGIDLVEAVRGALARLRGVFPDHHARLAAILPQWTGEALANALMPPPGTLGPDEPLPLALEQPLTANGVLRRVDKNDEHTVERVREALLALRQSDKKALEAIRSVLTAAAATDPSVLVPLMSAPVGAAIIDASNAAWAEQEAHLTSRPRLQPILDLRMSLRRLRYFPVWIYADAPLPYTIDEPERLRQMVANGEIMVVDSGVDADEILIREAKRRHAPIITNDYMTDWDPENAVLKIRYALAQGGAYVLASHDD